MGVFEGKIQHILFVLLSEIYFQYYSGLIKDIRLKLKKGVFGGKIQHIFFVLLSREQSLVKIQKCHFICILKLSLTNFEAT